MPRHLRFATIALGLTSLLISGITPARAGLIASVSVDIQPEAGGMSLYTYTIIVDPASTSAVSEFDLSLTPGTTSGIDTPVGAPLSSITMPTGFLDLYTPGDPTIAFSSTDPSTDIAPGLSGIFSFISLSNTASLPYLLSTFDGSGSTVSGSIISPIPVPEPLSLVLSSLGSFGVVGWLALARFRRPTVTSE